MTNSQAQSSGATIEVQRADLIARAATTAADVLQQMRVWSQRARQRRDLARLDSRLLADIGIRAEDARAEANKPFWRA